MALILHITDAATWREAQAAGAYSADSLATEGFIHCSTPAQIVRTANKFYTGRSNLVLLCIDEHKVTSDIRYEDLNAGDLFPHIYGVLNPDAVVKVIPYAAGEDGKFARPTGLEDLV